MIIWFEWLSEVLVILIFYVVGMVMEVFKIEVGLWIYLEDNLLCIGGVLLFLGFMYVVVGFYFVCVVCVFEFCW